MIIWLTCYKMYAFLTLYNHSLFKQRYDASSREHLENMLVREQQTVSQPLPNHSIDQLDSVFICQILYPTWQTHKILISLLVLKYELPVYKLNSWY